MRQISKTIRGVRFTLRYLPQLLKVLILTKYAYYKFGYLSADSEKLEAYFGPLYVLPNDPGVSASLRKGFHYDITLSVALEKYLQRGMSVLDVGANIGYFAALAALRTKSAVYCIEPDPRCIKILKKNKQLYPEITLFPIVASDHKGTEQFILDEASTGDSSIAAAKGSAREFPCDTLDNLIGDSKIDVIIIDTQGAELKIFKGGKNILRHTSKIFFEFWPYGLEKAGSNPKELLIFLKSQGFSIRHFFPSFHPNPNDIDAFIASIRARDSGRGFCNLLAIKISS